MVKHVLMAVAAAALVFSGSTAYAAQQCGAVCLVANPCDEGEPQDCDVCVGKGSPIYQCVLEMAQG